MKTKKKEVVRELTCPKLFLLPRTDMASMTPGMIAAQCAHAANAAVRAVKASKKTAFKQALKDWEGDYGYGTTVVLDGENIEKIGNYFGYLGSDLNSHLCSFGWTYDPTYPVKDGKVTHLINATTVGYVFFVDPPKWIEDFKLLTKGFSVW